MPTPARYSAPTSDGDGRIRLTYNISFSGRGQGARVLAAKVGEDGTLAEAEVKRIHSKLHALDTAIVQELRSTTVFGQIADAQLARILPLLAQRQATVDGDRLNLLDDEPLCPRVRVTHSPSGALQLARGLANEYEGWVDLDSGRLVSGSQAWFLRDACAHPIESPAPWELLGWHASPIMALGADLGVKDRDRLVRDLEKVGVPPEDLDQLAVRRGAPDTFVAQLWVQPPLNEGKSDQAIAHAASHPKVRMVLEAEYGGDRVLVTNQRPASAYVVKEGSSGGLIERDLAAEEDARLRVKECGFRFDKQDGTFLAKNEAALLALDPSSGVFPPYWIVVRTADSPQFQRDLRVHAEIRLLEDRGLVDVAVGFDAVQDDEATVEALVEMKDLFAWMESGQRYLRLNDGSFVAPSENFRKSVQLLEDLGANRHRILVSPLCVGLLKALGDTAAVKIADNATQSWLDELDGAEAAKAIEPPDGLGEIMRDYQHQGLNWLAMLSRHRLTGILADDMGLGKTLQALALLAYVKVKDGRKPSMVVAPTSVLGVWRDEAHRFTPSLKVEVWHGPPEVRHAVDIDSADLIITSYGVLRRDAEILSKTSFRYVILDEAQAAKNAASQNAKAIRQLISESRLALSGTPIENRTEELWAAFDFLAPGFLGNLRTFRKRYGRPIAQGENAALALLRARTRPLILRRLKSEVAKELPPKVESTMRCEMGPAQRALYEHIAGELRDSVLARIEKVGVARAQLEVLAALTRLRQICCDPAIIPNPTDVKLPPSAKLALFEELMREALESDRRIVVFSQFVKMQRILIKSIKKLGVDPLWLHGGTRDRDKVVGAFQDENGPPVIVVSLRAGGVGLTLTRADTVMHYDPWWNPAVEQQATDRAHRLGQTQTVSVYKLICAGSIEEKVLDLAARKGELAESLLSSEGGAGAKSITRDDVLNLLQ